MSGTFTAGCRGERGFWWVSGRDEDGFEVGEIHGERITGGMVKGEGDWRFDPLMVVLVTITTD